MDSPEPDRTGNPRSHVASTSRASAPHPDLQALAVQLRRLNGEINRLVHGFAASQGLHSTDVQALAAVLDSEEPLTPSLLRNRLGLTSGAVSACIDRLERAGHITRVRESTDRRVVHLRYVPGAQAQARRYFSPLAEATERVRGCFSGEELAVTLRFLSALAEELAEARPPRP
ncbi:MarR family winged helix-turn-helix transcriptional regulator [Streptomyces beihaiensis]|uniref:MarR family winged helix-turn-helix transcriptional regulator n=1 Tax=Streptomyces beihaiensis TaxID=2984495 RepID=A0ABT3TMS7_9ACTN|nr:MarR family winged helix-turn-helix transcriptional regulator [Streptomyces beihaiensis]MCX3058339.1 MarR family winged helix-turn-helix transcriptional regulator [Streptomyces beihaiensis]